MKTEIDILKDLVVTIDVTGGVRDNGDGTVSPAADRDWVDLGDVYRRACAVLSRDMKLEATRCRVCCQDTDLNKAGFCQICVEDEEARFSVEDEGQPDDVHG